MKKALALTLCLVSMFALSACDSNGGFLDDDNMSSNVAGDVDGDGNVDNLRTFVLANCNAAPSGDPAPINGASFPGPFVTDPANSAYTSTCIN